MIGLPLEMREEMRVNGITEQQAPLDIDHQFQPLPAFEKEGSTSFILID
jgi:hypothetical protein